MNIVIVYESLFGNTGTIADAIALGARRQRPADSVSVLPVAEAYPSEVSAADLLIVGGPTHVRGMTSATSRKAGLKGEREHPKPGAEHHEPDPGAEGPGIRDWFTGLPRVPSGHRAAAFDTRADSKLAGGAARGIVKRLRHHGYEVVADPEGFIIEGTEGPLRAGEVERAAEWGAALAQRPALSSHDQEG